MLALIYSWRLKYTTLVLAISLVYTVLKWRLRLKIKDLTLKDKYSCKELAVTKRGSKTPRTLIEVAVKLHYIHDNKFWYF